MVILIRSTGEVGGLQVGPLVEQILLYADDTLLYLSDETDSLAVALVIIDRYGNFSGVKINLGKTNLFSLSDSAPPPSHPTPLQRVFQFRYLGIEITNKLSHYLTDNLYPVMQTLIEKCQSWKTLPLTSVGRVNLLKMTFFTKFLYIFRNTPVPIPAALFCKLDRIVTSFIWGGKVPRIAKNKLQLPLSSGGLALPCFQKYYWAAVLVTVHWWFVQSRSNPAVNLESLGKIWSGEVATDYAQWGATPLPGTKGDISASLVDAVSLPTAETCLTGTISHSNLCDATCCGAVSHL